MNYIIYTIKNLNFIKISAGHWEDQLKLYSIRDRVKHHIPDIHPKLMDQSTSYKISIAGIPEDICKQYTYPTLNDAKVACQEHFNTWIVNYLNDSKLT